MTCHPKMQRGHPTDRLDEQRGTLALFIEFINQLPLFRQPQTVAGNLLDGVGIGLQHLDSSGELLVLLLKRSILSPNLRIGLLHLNEFQQPHLAEKKGEEEITIHKKGDRAKEAFKINPP